MLAIIALFGVAVASVLITDAGADAEPDTEAAADSLNDDNDATTSTPLQESFTSGDTLNSVGQGQSDETITGTIRADLLVGTEGDDVIAGEDGEDTLHGHDGHDTLFGGNAKDTLFGDVGDDTLDGGDHDDELIGGSGDDTLFGGDGDDTLLGSFGDDVLSGGNGQDLLNGGAGNDVLIGNDDAEGDYLNGGRGDDIIRSGAGDTAHGGAGADTFALDADAEDGAYIEDYDPDEDIIEVVYDAEGPIPELTTTETENGLALYADGDFVAGFANITSIDLDRIALVAA
ncbi:Ca2+-binding RTX toxin-like protein [Loktanella ponticola]|uniref:Ca2+-binding RTX toxin-like protein n=1 Tax=Yoonia ponticola TaxID=1524255 RepID=A0A7W9BH60_9RHOB|nr:calcium-binding protein [Yoonia ponticola]MBB5720468.1 Ca2+-binding RTX toxin-like protein [Yoonia ponticola]